MRISIRRIAATAAIGAVLSLGSAGVASARGTMTPRSTDGQPCADWTNEDGTHGTNCPAPPHPGGGIGVTGSRIAAPF